MLTQAASADGSQTIGAVEGSELVGSFTDAVAPLIGTLRAIAKIHPWIEGELKRVR